MLVCLQIFIVEKVTYFSRVIMDDIIKPNVLLNAEEMFECNKNLEDYQMHTKGTKDLKSDCSLSTEERRADFTLESLYELLKIERVYPQNSRSRGIYEKEKNRVKLFLIVGKLTPLGFFNNKKMYLRPFEALLLMEMNRLEVTFEGVVMSIEEAYSAFLNEHCEISLEEYIVFSYFTRIGYHVMLHDPKFDEIKLEKRNSNLEDEMIWHVLFKKLKLPYSHSIINKNPKLYMTTEDAMNKHATAISNAFTEDSHENKMEVDPECSNPASPPHKKIKIELDEDENNFLDILKTELEYMTYKDIFNKFNYISRKKCDSVSHENVKQLNFIFDLFLPKGNFKKTENLANYRVIVLKSNGHFPNNEELMSLYKRQCYQVPIIIAVVSDNLTINFSICAF